MPEAGDLSAEFLRLACLTYGDERRGAEAERLLAAHPEVATASAATMAVTGEADALAAALAADPASARAQTGPYQWEPLLYLAYGRVPSRDPLRAARLLLDHGADPDAGYLWDGLSPPFTALTGVFGGGERAEPPHPQSLELARLLLEAGADPNDAQTLYNRGLRGDDTAYLELLFEYGLGRDSTGPWSARLGPALPTPAQMLQDQVLTAARSSRPRRLKMLIDHGADVNGHGTHHPIFGGRTAHDLAVLGGHTEVADLLLAAGAASALDETDLLLAAVVRADTASATRLAGHLPQALARMPHLVAHAAANGTPESVQLAVRLGFDVNHLGRAAALHEAAVSGDLAMVTTLVELGADPALRDRDHDAPAQGWAEHGGHQEVAAYLARLT
ncbi:hypothetical protein [Nonomuraea sp. NPDC046570]|uniref:hypothetical protein n=1 Tax=Nonomuraea sp. NPDC046570 TaxID=3155255 RepID=UPI0033F6DA20